jgi:hypothetical protein
VLVGFLDRAKGWLGLTPTAEADEEPPATGSQAGAARSREGRPAAKRRDGRERPPLKDVEAAPSAGIEDVLAARAAGDHAEARRILREIDRGGGLRTVLRAAAALEAGDEEELAPLHPAVASEDPPWRLALQVAAALAAPAKARPFLERAARDGAPAWAVAWSRAISDDETTRREGLVALLFEDPALARTVAARDLAVAGVSSDPSAAQRYASFSHGRDSIRKFGPELVARLLDRAWQGTPAPARARGGR